MPDLEDAVRAWVADDPHSGDRGELLALLDRIAEPDVRADLTDRFAGPLTFGTAGLRGPLRAGPNGMNLAVVARAAAGLAAYLDESGAVGPVVIGYDARHRSDEFAVETARIVSGRGRAALLLPRRLPTPVLAFAVRHLDAAAGVMVTASHNPPQDNGYKVYLGGPAGHGAQIVPPADAAISVAIGAVGRLADVPRSDDYRTLGEDVVEAYVDGVARAVRADSARDLSTVSTAMSGVGGPTLAAAFTRAGFTSPVPVAEQQEPDPDFAGLPFPNPEEHGAMDRLLALAVATDADLAIANDPDADRCAVAAPMRGGWRALTGDELGVLLAEHLIRGGATGTFATTIVSSSLLSEVCTARGVPFAETLTGFKWIVRGFESTGVPLRFGYEEAIGYCVAPALVNDKDGISAALLAAELGAELKATGSSVQARLDAIHAEFGAYQTGQVSVRVADLSVITDTMARLRSQPPTNLGEVPVETTDVLPRTDALVLRGDGLRVVIRPSGTEPKLKAYFQIVQPVTDADVVGAHATAATRLSALRNVVQALVA